MTVCIGLFGTCANVRWRDSFMKTYDYMRISYYNPMVDKWDSSAVAEEAQHLAEDSIILFPVLKDSLGLASLAEVSIGPLKAQKQHDYRSFVVFIEDDVIGNDENSLRSRALVKGHLKNMGLPNVYIVNSLEEMLDVSIQLHRIHSSLDELKKFQA